MSDKIDRLERLNALYQSGVLTPEEFNLQKAEILGGSSTPPAAAPTPPAAAPTPPPAAAPTPPAAAPTPPPAATPTPPAAAPTPPAAAPTPPPAAATATDNSKWLKVAIILIVGFFIVQQVLKQDHESNMAKSEARQLENDLEWERTKSARELAKEKGKSDRALKKEKQKTQNKAHELKCAQANKNSRWFKNNCWEGQQKELFGD